MPTAPAQPARSSRSAWVYIVPRVATRPKKTNTNSSPKPL